MIDKFFKFFFICSCLLIFLFLGLYFEYLKIRFFVYFFIILFIFFIFLIGFFYARRDRKFISLISFFLINIIFYIAGFQIHKEGIFNVSDWVIQSINQINNSFNASFKYGFFKKFSVEKNNEKYKEFKKDKFNQIKEQIVFNDPNFESTIFVRFKNDIFTINFNKGIKEFNVFMGDSSKIYPMPFIKNNYFLAYEYNKVMKIDYFGNVKWSIYLKTPENNRLHHWGDVMENKIYLPSRNFIDLPNEISQKIGPYFQNCYKKNSFNDTIEIFDEKLGQHIKTIELNHLFVEFTDLHFYFRNCVDPIHLNDVRIIKEKSHAKFFKDGKVGDLLISLGNIHTIALLDKDTYQIKWYAHGDFTRQHSPRITNRGTIIIFDNVSSNPKNGNARVTEIDIKTKKVVGFYEATKDDYFLSEVGGRIQLIDDRIFVQESDNGRVFELVCYEKEEYLSNKCKQKVILEFKKEYISDAYGYMYIADIIN